MNTKSIALATAAVLAGSALAVSVATADIYVGGSASAVCKAAAGPGADVFYFDSMTALNLSAGVQYLTCDIPNAGRVNGASSTGVNVHYSNPTGTAKDFTCVIQSYHAGTSVASAIYVETVPSSTAHYQKTYFPASTPALPGGVTDGIYVMSCAIPAGGRLDSVQAYFPGAIPAA